LLFGEFRDARTERLGQQQGEAKTFFEADDAVLHLDGVLAHTEHEDHGGQGEQDQQDGVEGVVMMVEDEVDYGKYQSNEKHGKDEEVKDRVPASVMGV
jgi:hypothetical protein